MKKYLLSLSLIATLLFSCVPARKFEETNMKYKKCEEEAERLKTVNREMETELTENRALIKEINRKVENLERDTANSGNAFRQLTKNYDKLGVLS